MPNPDPPPSGVLQHDGELIEPFGEERFVEAAERFARQALRLRDEGFARLRLDGAPSLALCRAALIGGRVSGLPIDVTLLLGEDGRSPAGSDPLAALVTLQSLGAASFGFAPGSDPLAVEEETVRLAPWARIPFFPVPGEAAHPAAEPVRLDEGSVVAACGSGVFVLEEGFEYSEPLPCELDMSDDILQVEDHSHEVLLVRVDTIDDAHSFSLNAHMARLPVGFASDSEEALEMALALFDGRALVDSISELPRETLVRLANAYGAHVV